MHSGCHAAVPGVCPCRATRSGDTCARAATAVRALVGTMAGMTLNARPAPALSPSGRVRVVCAVLRSAPTLPAPLLDDALSLAAGHGDDADSVMRALLGRHELDLGALVSDPQELAGRHPVVRAAYLTRPELSPTQMRQFVQGQFDLDLARAVVRNRRSSSDLLLAVVDLCSDVDVLELTAKRISADVPARAAAVVKAWALLTSPAAQSDDARESLNSLAQIVSSSGRRDLVNAVAMVATDPSLLVVCGRGVSTSGAADRVVREGILRLLEDPAALSTLELLTLGGLYRVDHASGWLSHQASATACTELADWWQGAGGTWAATQHSDDQAGSPERVASLVTCLRGAGSLDSRPWIWAPGYLAVDGEVELSAHLVEAFGDNAHAWELYPTIAADFCGSVGELVDAVLAAAAPAANEVA